MIPRRLAPAAARERDLWTRHRDRMVASGQATAAEADAAIAAWSVLAELIAKRSCETDLTWADLAAVTARALERREADAAAKPGNPRAAERRDLVAAIHRGVSRQRAFIDDLNAALRRRAERDRAEAEQERAAA
jgi:hypothetical protein